MSVVEELIKKAIHTVSSFAIGPHDMSRSLSGLKKLKYDKEHELVMYENTRADLKTLLAEGEKITPKAWRTEEI